MYQRGADIFHNSHIVVPTRYDVLPQNILIFSLSFLSRSVPVSPGALLFCPFPLSQSKMNFIFRKFIFSFVDEHILYTNIGYSIDVSARS